MCARKIMRAQSQRYVCVALCVCSVRRMALRFRLNELVFRVRYLLSKEVNLILS